MATWPRPTNQVEQFYCQPFGQEKGGSLSDRIGKVKYISNYIIST